MYVVVYNGLAQERSSIIDLPVSSKAMYSLEEVGSTKRRVRTVPAVPTLGVAPGGVGGAPYRITFQARDVPPLGAKVYKVAVAGSFRNAHAPGSLRVNRNESDSLRVVDVWRGRRLSNRKGGGDDVVASNEYFSATFDG